jgi:phosphatidylinositol glycan class V
METTTPCPSDSICKNNSLTEAAHLRLLLWASLAAHAVVAALVYLATFLPVFDASASTILPPSTPRLVQALLRWDSFHFGAIALDDYKYEHQWAFFGLLPIHMRVGLYAARFFGLSSEADWSAVLVAGALVALLYSIHTPRALYRLSLLHLRSHNLALLAALLSVVPASPAALLFAPYTEPYFAAFSFQGASPAAPSSAAGD